MTLLQERVDQAMTDALENGFNMADLQRPDLIAMDLMDCCDDFASLEYDRSRLQVLPGLARSTEQEGDIK